MPSHLSHLNSTLVSKNEKVLEHLIVLKIAIKLLLIFEFNKNILQNMLQRLELPLSEMDDVGHDQK